MNQNTISPDDPRLTAYAFNEMTAAERAEFETLLQADPAARQAVEEIRSAGAMLATALEHEPLAQGAPPAAAEKKKPAGSVIRFPHFYYIASGLAAACFAMFFAYTEYNHQATFKAKHYVAVPLQPAVAAAPAPAAEAVPMDVVAVESGEAVTDSLALKDISSADEQRRDVEARNQAVAAKVAAEGLSSRAAPRMRMVVAPMGFGAVPKDAGFDTEAYGYQKENDFLMVKGNPQSTFSIDVDTASYANVRRFINEGRRPPVDAVRIEELVNYFPYRYQPPAGNVPFSANLEVASAPWAPEHRLVRIGLKGREVSDAARPAANLVFLLDVSGSMEMPNKLPLVKQSLRLLVDKLRPDDHVAIAVYAGASGLALPSTPVSHKAEILDAIEQLSAGGSTNGAMGIQLAYDIAKANFVPSGVNRVILATDGDFNVGVTSEGELVRLIEEKAKSGVFLSVLGFGMGNLKDSTLEKLADKGNGNYAYIDSLAEAKKALVEQAGGTLVTIAKDVKIQVEFNPAQAQAYRLIGYENRLLRKEDFNNDKVDAGEIGAGHTVTALYEVVPVGAAMPEAGTVEALKYQRTEDRGQKTDSSGELLTVSIRYKEPAADESQKLAFPLRDTGARFEQASEDFKFAAAVASFGMLLRESPHRGNATLADISAWARAGVGSDAGGYRTEFLGLAERSKAIIQ